MIHFKNSEELCRISLYLELLQTFIIFWEDVEHKPFT